MANLRSPGTHSISFAPPNASVEGRDTFVSACMGSFTPASFVPTAVEIHVLVRLPGIVPARDRQLARDVTQAVVRRCALVRVNKEAESFMRGKLSWPLGEQMSVK